MPSTVVYLATSVYDRTATQPQIDLLVLNFLESLGILINPIY